MVAFVTAYRAALQRLLHRQLLVLCTACLCVDATLLVVKRACSDCAADSVPDDDESLVHPFFCAKH